MPIAGYFFIAGVLLAMICGLRINVRVLRRMGAWQRTRKSHPVSDYITSELERIRLSNTVGFEIAGLGIALATIAFAIQFLNFR